MCNRNKNFITRHETCHLCNKDIPVWEYAPYNHDDYIRVLSVGTKVALCTNCWNKSLDRLAFGPLGWELAVQS